MTGYTRQSAADITTSNTIQAAHFNNEYNAIQAAFDATSGHTHGGGTGEGAPITAIGPAQEVTVGATEVTPATTGTVSLGTSDNKFKDAYLSGNLNAGGTLTITGTAALSSTLAVTGAATLSSTLAVTGAVTGSSTVTGTRLISTIATGTAPLGVTSTTVVPNLNADMLDGQHASAFLTAEADTLATVTARGATTATALSITNATDSSSTTTGALKVTGGIGVGGTATVTSLVSGTMTGNTVYTNALRVKNTAPIYSDSLYIEHSSGTGLSIINSGTGTALYISSGVIGAPAVVVDKDRNLVVGHYEVVSASASATPGVQNLGGTSTASVGLFGYSAGAGSHRLIIARSRNATVGSHTALMDGDTTGRITFEGSDGTAFQMAASIYADVQGTVSSGMVPGRLVFATTDTAGVSRVRMVMDNAGGIGIGVTSPSSAALMEFSSTTRGVLFPRMTTTQRDAISSPPDGLVVFNSTAGKLQVRASSAWVDLH